MRTRIQDEEAAMFDGGLIDRDVAIEALVARTEGACEADWKDLHRRLRSIAKRRVALEAEEASYLVEAEETQLYRRLGYTTMIEYMERELHWGPHAANPVCQRSCHLELATWIPGLERSASELFPECEGANGPAHDRSGRCRPS
jgi:hypothetical protein